eukprot:m.755 g.755  ORF g.755 m.755 type:complete len:541 (+) comp632_c0_seq1:213-1835(+)
MKFHCARNKVWVAFISIIGLVLVVGTSLLFFTTQSTQRPELLKQEQTCCAGDNSRSSIAVLGESIKFVVEERIEGSTPSFEYDLVNGADIDENDLGFIKKHGYETMKAICDATPSCKAFNSNGWLKTGVRPRVASNADLWIKLEDKHHQQQQQQQHRQESASLNKQISVKNGVNILDLALNIEREEGVPFKIHIYNLPPDLSLSPTLDYKYQLEAKFIACLRQSANIEPDLHAERIDAFLIPVHCAEARYLVKDRDEGQRKAEDHAFSVLNFIRRNYPFWDHSKGADHFFLCGHDMGASIRTALEEKSEETQFARNMVGIVNTADVADSNFHVFKDISAPPHVGDQCPTCIQGGHDCHEFGTMLVQNSNEPIPRTKLAFFAGNFQRGRVRPLVMQAFRDHEHFHFVDGYMSPKTYMKALYSSEYCLVLRGYRAWTPRLLDAVWAACIPVIISDDYVLPFNRWIDWNRAAVIVPESNINYLDSILSDDGPNRCDRRNYLKTHVSHLLTWAGGRGKETCTGAFEYLMKELWLRFKPKSFHCS